MVKIVLIMSPNYVLGSGIAAMGCSGETWTQVTKTMQQDSGQYLSLIFDTKDNPWMEARILRLELGNPPTLLQLPTSRFENVIVKGFTVMFSRKNYFRRND